MFGAQDRITRKCVVRFCASIDACIHFFLRREKGMT